MKEKREIIVEIETKKGKKYFKVDKKTARVLKGISQAQVGKPNAKIIELNDVAFDLAKKTTGSVGLPTENSARVRILSED